MRILLIEDDEVLTNVLLESLQQQRYVVDTVDDGRFGLEYAESGTYDLLLIDVGLPRLDGISICQQLRNQGSTTPVLLMTAKDAPDEKIRGLDAGADDYLTKPLDIGELHARLRALLRRGEVAPATVLEIGQLRLNPMSCEVTYADNLLKLTPKEYSLLELFLRNPTRVFSRSHIIEHLWTFDDPPLEDSVKAHIKGLRRRLKKAGADDWIENVYGLGYKLSPKIDYEALAKPSKESSAVSHQKKAHSIAASSDAGRSQEITSETSVAREFEQAMAELWIQHRDAMRDRLSRLQQAEAALTQNKLTDKIRQSAAQAAHKLAGVLGMFGKDEGTQVARTLEERLLDSQKTKPEAVSPLVAQLSAILDLADPQVSKNTLDQKALETVTARASVQTGETTILAVDDDPIFLSTLSPMLEPWGITVVTLSDPMRFWETLNATEPELIVLDIEMPRLSGIELCQAVRSESFGGGRWQSLPVLFLTNRQNAAGEVFAAGADDYVIKPVLGPELITRISNRIERTRLLKTLSSRDGQTGLLNQMQFQHHFVESKESKEVENKEQNESSAFVLIRLENLEQINLLYGHSTGQKVLRAWGDAILLWQKAVKTGQELNVLASYWGSGDFVITLAGASREVAKNAIAPLLRTFRQRVFNSEIDLDESDSQDRFQAQYTTGIVIFPKGKEGLRSLYRKAFDAMKVV